MLASTTYNPGSVTTATSGPVLGAGSSEVQSLMEQLIAKRIRDAMVTQPAPVGEAVDPYEAQLKQIALERARFQAQQEKLAAERARKLGLEEDLTRKKAGEREDIAWNESSQPIPQRMVMGAGIIPGYTPDPMVMSGRQRAMFLPQQSVAHVTPEDETNARLKYLGEGGWAQRWANQGFSDAVPRYKG